MRAESRDQFHAELEKARDAGANQVALRVERRRHERNAWTQQPWCELSILRKAHVLIVVGLIAAAIIFVFVIGPILHSFGVLPR